MNIRFKVFDLFNVDYANSLVNYELRIMNYELRIMNYELVYT